MVLNKVGCVFWMVAVSILPYTEFGRHDHRERAFHFTNDSKNISLILNPLQHRICKTCAETIPSMNHRTTSLSPAAQFKTHLPTFKNKSTKSHKLGFQNDNALSLAENLTNQNHFETLKDLRKLRNYQHDPMARDLKMNSGHPILITIWQNILLSLY